MPDVLLQQLATEDVTVEPAQPRIVTTYWARGSTDLSDVLLAVRRQDAAPAGTVRVPTVLRGLPLVGFDPQYNGGLLWTVTARYGVPEAGAVPAAGMGTPTSPPPPPPPGVAPPATPAAPAGGDLLTRDFSFDTTGGTVTKRVSEFNRHRVGVTTPPDFLKSINVGPNGVEGCEVVARKFELTITRQFAYLTRSYLDTVYDLTGKVNNAPFMGFAGDTAGTSEVLLLGVTGQGRDDGAWTVTFRFAVSKNRTELLIPSTSEVSFGGHDFVWYVFETTTSNNRPVEVPKFAYVERVYKVGDFSLLGVFA